MSSINSVGTLLSYLGGAQSGNQVDSMVQLVQNEVESKIDAAAISQDASAISSPGQLYSNLQKLQAQDPTTFKTVVAQIASQLQTAAREQGDTAQGLFLSNLAQKFQNVANGGDLSQLTPTSPSNNIYAVYALGAEQPSEALALLGLSSTSNSTQTNLLQLVTSISQEVSGALNGTSATTT